MRRLIVRLVLLAVVGAGVFWWLTRPTTDDPAAFAALTGDAARGEAVFWAGGCASCHSAAKAEGAARLVLEGGQRFVTAFGTFVAPNISADASHGIGGWTVADLANAMRHGTSPQGQHYYPAFPYTSYAHATLQDVADLHAYLATLPAAARPNDPHDLGFPFNQRLLMGGWKFLFARGGWVIDGDLSTAEERGRYLVEGLGHCSECHTPRNLLGARQTPRWLAGGPNPDGPGTIPNITPGRLTWTQDEVAAYLESGFTPDFDSAGGSMADVVANLSQLPEADRLAIAAYLARVPPVK